MDAAEPINAYNSSGEANEDELMPSTEAARSTSGANGNGAVANGNGAVANGNGAVASLPAESAADSAQLNGNGRAHRLETRRLGRFGDRTRRPRVSVVIPTMNEAANIAWVLERLPPVVEEVVLVDGRSTDGTIEVAKRARPDLRIVTEERPGKGAALRAGFAAAQGDFIAMIDADRSMDPAEIPRLIEHLEERRSDRPTVQKRRGHEIVKGSRFMPGGGTDDMEVVRQLGNRALLMLLNRLYGAGFTDLCYGLLAFRRDQLERLELGADGFEIEAEILVQALECGLDIGEVPSFEAPRHVGESNLNTWRDGLRVLRTLVGTRLTRDLGSFAGLAPAIRARLTAGGGRRERRRARPVAPSQRHGATSQLFPWTPDGRPTAVGSISVVLCTYSDSRWAHLVDALDSLRRQTVEDVLALEVIVVVDHNPTLLARVRRELPDVVAMENLEAPGLSGARNSGVAAASGGIIAFLDDDAVAAPDWLERLTSSYVDPAVIGVGGSIRPAWPAERPRWLPRELDWVVGCSYHGLPSTKAEVRNPIGANMSFRREVFQDAGPFLSRIGRTSKRPMGCEETELSIRARRRFPSGQVLFDPDAVVDHRIAPERGRWRYLLSRCYAEGLSKAIVSAHAGEADGLASERDYVARTLPRGFAREMRAAFLGRDRIGIARAAAIVIALGLTAAGYGVGRLQLAIHR
jgi:glycosyltransferase involved in cell wall biosynthesis